ncbi:MarR family winged helix-turn-helix transcriptional regulator [Gordonia insulae]|uniref:Putative HTH-type transcriptional regulator n=1 Tax=Gordonia insulae TaxID=2420509 RepID=A0A3G8JK64_9ACTN|nr:MarR family transcriptional regulator [Gordonia insulae]AZG44922.1 putative HTH-type transcriptional regulator [Gordonia insulae]
MSDDVDLPAIATDFRVALGQLIRRLRQQSHTSDLTRSQTNVLGRLEREGPATANELARAEGMRPQSMAAIVGALLEAGLVSGTRDPRDGRKTILDLSQQARDEFRAGRLAREDWLAGQMAAVLTDGEIAHLASATDLLRRLAES